MNPWVQILVTELPGLIAFLKTKFKTANPDQPVPTSEEVIAAFELAFSTSLAKDQILKAALQAEVDAEG